MRLLLDTQLLLWTSASSERLPIAVREAMERPETEPFFSVISLWELVIKRARGRATPAAPIELRQGLLEHGYTEIPVSAAHVLMVANIPLLHHDPFDRLLLAQAMVEEMTLLTTDAGLGRYPGPVRVV